MGKKEKPVSDFDAITTALRIQDLAGDATVMINVRVIDGEVHVDNPVGNILINCVFIDTKTITGKKSFRGLLEVLWHYVTK